MSMPSHPGLRLLGRRAARRQRLGRLRSDQSEEPAAALRAAGRALRQGAHEPCWSTRRPTCASSCSTRASRRRRRALHARPRRPHARHRRPARHLLQRQAAHPRYVDARTRDMPDEALRLLFRAAAGLLLSGHPRRARHLEPAGGPCVDGAGGAVEAVPILQDTAILRPLASASAASPTPPISAASRRPRCRCCRGSICGSSTR